MPGFGFGHGFGAAKASLSALAAALALDFTTGSLDPRVTFTRASSATWFDAAGAMQIASTNAARFDHDPATLAPRGLLIEEQRANLLLNSLIDGTSLSTQSAAVSATAYTLSFYGTGTVTLSGASTAGPLTGAGNTVCSSLTFTPTAGTLTLTVTGTVKWANLEAGSFATSFIPTAGASATRAADLAIITGAGFSSWFNGSAGTFVINSRVRQGGYSISSRVFGVSNGTTANRIRLIYQASTLARTAFDASSVSVALLDNAISDVTAAYTKVAAAFSANDFAAASNGGAVASDTSGAVPALDRLAIGSYEGGTGGNYLNGWIKSLTFYAARLADAKLQELTA